MHSNDRVLPPRSHVSVPSHRPRATLVVLVAGLILAAGPVPVSGQAADEAAVDSVDYRALWEAGESYRSFHEAARGRRELWERNTARAAVRPAVVARARAVPGRWRLLVVALDRCSDSVGTLPWLAALSDSVATLDLRVIPPDLGREAMEAYRTPDGRAATPTVVVLREDGSPAGAWVERPSELQRWFLENPEGLSHDQRHYRKMAWYDEDAGESTVAEVVELLEAAR